MKDKVLVTYVKYTAVKAYTKQAFIDVSKNNGIFTNEEYIENALTIRHNGKKIKILKIQ